MPRKESLESKRLKIINKNTTELHEDVDNLYENLVDGDFEKSIQNLEDLKGKIKLIEAMVKEGHVLKPKK